MNTLVRKLIQQTSTLWWECDTHLPDLGATYEARQQFERQSKVNSYLKFLGEVLDGSPSNGSGPHPDHEMVFFRSVEIAREVWNLEERHIQAIRGYGFLEIGAEFARAARHFDPYLSDEQIFQASRNIWSMNFMQLLMGLPIALTPSVFAYSLLYPYSDNYLDDPLIPYGAKRDFNRRFRRRLEGEAIFPANRYEETICALIAVIEGEWDRRQNPQVYESLLAIHAAQHKSLQLLNPEASPYELDILVICFEKGGTSVLADGYLVAGDLTPAQQEFTFYYGVFTQLMDDLEDVQQDLQSGLMTIYSQTAMRWPLDAITNRTLHFGQCLLKAMQRLETPEAGPFLEVFRRNLAPLIVSSAGSFSWLYTRPYIRQLQAHFPLRFSYVKRLRRRFSKQFLPVIPLVESLGIANGTNRAGITNGTNRAEYHE